jgi:hypothetical protein
MFELDPAFYTEEQDPGAAAGRPAEPAAEASAEAPAAEGEAQEG